MRVRIGDNGGKHAGQLFVRSRASLRSLVENSPYGIYVSSLAEDRFVTVNRALVEMLGYRSKDEVLALHLSKDVYCDPAEQQRLIVQGRKPDRLRRLEVELKRKDGSRISVCLSGRALRDGQGEVIGFEGIMDDITERKKLEQQFYQAQKMEAIGTLAGGLAHDFNNQLMVVLSYANLLKEHLSEDEGLYRQADAILKAARRGANLTRQLLAFSRRQVLAPRVLNLNDLFAELKDMLVHLLGEHIEVKMVLRPDLGRVWVDPGQLEQILMNLATNARDAMPRGGKLIIETANVELDKAYAQTHAGAKPGRYVMLAVSDTGVGMDAETRSHIFQPFFTTKKEGKGTGLGLASVYGIVKQSGGFIWVYSEPGKGATFKIYFPRARQAIKEKTPELPPVAILKGSATILLVEDETEVLAAVFDYLQQRGFNVLKARNGAEALKIVEHYSGLIHAIVTDVVMPGMSGPELADRVAAGRPEIRTIFTSGYTGDSLTHFDLVRPSAVLLQKPFQLEELVLKLQQVLGTEE